MRKISSFISLVLVASLLWSASFVLAQTASTTPSTGSKPAGTPELPGPNAEEIEALNKEIAARKERIRELEDTIGKYKKNIEQKQLEAVSLRNQLIILDNRLAALQADIELTKEKIKETQLEIEALQLSIEDKEKVMARQRRLIDKMVKDIHISDEKDYLEIMLTYENFADFYSEVKYVENVYVDLGRSVKALRIAKEELAKKKKQMEEKRVVYEKLKVELEGKRADLGDQMNYKQGLLVETKSSEMKYQPLLTSLKQQYQVIEGEVRSYEAEVRKKLEQQNKIQESGDILLSWPVPSRYITAYFHDTDYPYRKVFEHNAIDIRAAQGTPVKAAASGYIARARRCDSPKCYSYVLIVHTGELSTVYGHLSKISVSEDDFVNRGDVIGYSGGTPGTNGAGPFVTGAHLHFETRENGIPVDPLKY